MVASFCCIWLLLGCNGVLSHSKPHHQKHLYPSKHIPDQSIEYGVHSDDELSIMTQSGLIEGQFMSSDVRAFRSIPYAAPPIDELRWQNPEAVEPWGNNTYQATSDPPGCPQTCYLPPKTCPAVQSEDCLYLNIYTPSVEQLNDELVNVFVFIHGGNFKQGYGGGLIYNGTEWVNLTNTIVITINYRLGALGFLFSVEAGMDGNFGFLDQKLALQWIHDNIEYFGGNNSKVTIFGQSAGAVSVALHMAQTSEDDSSLFQYAIMESEPLGTPLRDTTTWAALPKAFFNYLGCNESIAEKHDNIKFWECLRNKSIDDIIEAQDAAEADTVVEVGHFMDLFMPWTPTVGSDLFNSQPLFMFQQSMPDSNSNNNNNNHNNHNNHQRSQTSSSDDNMIRDVPFMIGTVMNEGVEFIYMAYPNGVDREQLDQTLVLLVGPDVALHIREHYPLPRNTTDYRDYLSLVATDGLFKCPTRNITASFVGNNYNSFAFLYHFDQVSSFNKVAWGVNYTECFDVVCHGAELPYIFRDNLGPINESFTTKEFKLAKAMQSYWTDFGKNDGKSPGKGGKFANDVQWEPFILGTEQSMLFKAGNVQIQSQVDMDDSKCKFWDSTGYSWIK